MSKIKTFEAQLKQEKARETYVKFHSPGTLTSEVTTKKCGLGQVKAALRHMKSIKERHGATPYGFNFVDGNGQDLSGMYYVTGTVTKFCDLPNTKENTCLRSNMKINNRPIIIENNNSYKFTYYFDEDDVVIDWDGKVLRGGCDYDLVEYRQNFNKN